MASYREVSNTRSSPKERVKLKRATRDLSTYRALINGILVGCGSMILESISQVIAYGRERRPCLNPGGNVDLLFEIGQNRTGHNG